MIHSGFFNAINNDRKYNAEDMCKPYHRIVSNGIFAKPSGESSDDFRVIQGTGLSVIVSVGEGIFLDKWTELDAAETISIELPDTSNPRIDTVVIKADLTSNVRAVSIKVVKGTPATSPVRPTLTSTTTVKEYPLADIYVAANATSITQSNITDRRTDAGFVTHLLYQSDMTSTYLQWQTQFNTWFEDIKSRIGTLVNFRQLTNTYTATSSVQDIPIGISNYVKESDFINVFINGFRLDPASEFTVTDNTKIHLAYTIETGAKVEFQVLKVI